MIQPVVTKINEYYASYQSLSNDQLRAKTNEFKQRIKKHLETIDAAISKQQQDAEALDITDDVDDWRLCLDLLDLFLDLDGVDLCVGCDEPLDIDVDESLDFLLRTFFS